MCTVVIEVPPRSRGDGPRRPTVPDTLRLLAVRDEDPGRPWDSLGEWWPELPGVQGVRDRRAGGAWLAVNPGAGRLAVLLNRAEGAQAPLPAGPLISRGTLPLAAVTGTGIADPPGTAAFNLLAIDRSRAEVLMWDGITLERTELEPGIHMIAHYGVDDVETTPRIASWLPRFRALAGLPEGEWQPAWIELLGETGVLPPDDDRAIIRDNRSHGFPTLSLMVCLAEVPTAATGAPPASLLSAELAEPGVWGNPAFS